MLFRTHSAGNWLRISECAGNAELENEVTVDAVDRVDALDVVDQEIDPYQTITSSHHHY